MGRVRWRNPLPGKMPANVQVSRVFSLLYDLMMLLRFSNGVLLGLNVIGESLVTRFVFTADLGDVFFNRTQLLVRGREFLLRQARGIGAAESRPNQLGAFIGQARPARGNSGDLAFQIRRRRIDRLNLGQFFQQLLVGGVVFLNPMLDRVDFTLAKFGRGLGVIPPLQNRLFLRVQLRHRLGLFFRVVLALDFDVFDSLFDLRDSQRDFLLFLLELLERDDLVAQLGEMRGLGCSFPPESDFTFLEQPFFVSQHHASALPADFQPDFAQTCANEVHDYSSAPASFASTLKSSRVVVSPVTFAPLAISLSKRRMIFPLRVLGRASAKRTSSGLAIAPI